MQMRNNIFKLYKKITSKNYIELVFIFEVIKFTHSAYYVQKALPFRCDLFVNNLVLQRLQSFNDIANDKVL